MHASDRRVRTPATNPAIDSELSRARLLGPAKPALLGLLFPRSVKAACPRQFRMMKAARQAAFFLCHAPAVVPVGSQGRIPGGGGAPDGETRGKGGQRVRRIESHGWPAAWETTGKAPADTSD